MPLFPSVPGCSRHKKLGLSLVSVMVALALFGVFALIFMQFLKNQGSSQSELQGEVDLLNVRRQILSQIDCAATVALIPPNCANGTFVQVRSTAPGNPVLIRSASDQTGTVMAGYNLRAQCSTCSTCPGGKKLLIEAARYGSNGNFKSTALTKKTQAWQDINNSIPIGCSLP